jgi:hypothetical protein
MLYLLEGIEMAYVYEIEHIKSGKRYIGSRTAKNCNPDELLILGGEDHPRGYLTSSKIVNAIIENEGNSAFKINFIEIFESKKDALERETELLNIVNARSNAIYLNCHNNEIELNNKKLCELYGVENVSQIPWVKVKIIDSRLKWLNENPDYMKGESNPMYGKTGEDSAFFGMKHSEETIKMLSDINSGENNPNFGKKASEETLRKMSEKSKNQERLICPHCGKEGRKSNILQWHFDKCKHKMPL